MQQNQFEKSVCENSGHPVCVQYSVEVRYLWSLQVLLEARCTTFFQVQFQARHSEKRGNTGTMKFGYFNPVCSRGKGLLYLKVYYFQRLLI